MGFSEYLGSPEFKRGSNAAADSTIKQLAKLGHILFKAVIDFVKEFVSAISGK